jgi:mRNA-degrading endonuclease RelE of RelBE toxin-antitoxin system
MFFRVIGRLTLRILKGVGKFIYAPFRWMAKHPVGGVFSLLIVGGLITTAVFTNWFGIPGLFRSNPSSSMVVTPDPSVAPTGGSTLVLSGIAEFNAAKIWDGLNPDYRKQFVNEGYNVANMQLAIDEAKKSVIEAKGDIKYNGFELRRQAPIPRTGGKLELYLGSTQFNDKVSQYVYQVQLDKDGKVTSISNPEGESDPIMTAAFKKPKTKEDNAPQSGVRTAKQLAAVEQMMAGLTTFDPDKMWQSFSPEYQKQLSAQTKKIDLTAIKKNVEQIKGEISKSKERLGYAGYVFLYSYEYPNGTVYTFYTAVLQYNDTPREFSYGFLTDQAGRIIAINSDDSILNSLLGRAQG